MSQVAVLLWLGAAGARLSAEPDLSSFAQGRHLTLRPPFEGQGPILEPYAAELAQRIERDLEHARIAAASLEEERSLEELRLVEATLRAHPELPQGAWLMAEVLAIQTEIHRSRGAAPTTIAPLEERRAVLEGERALRFTTQASDTGPITSTPRRPDETADATPSMTVELSGLAARDRVEWNGTPATRSVVVRPGEHHVRVIRSGRAVWARWVSLTAGQAGIELSVPRIAPCSSDDFDGVEFGTDRVVAEGVSCGL